MKNISLSDSEAQEMVSFYERELEKAQERVKTLQDMLNKLKSGQSKVGSEKKRRKNSKTAHIDLTNFIASTLAEKNEVLVVSDFGDIAIEQYALDLTDDEKKQFTANISATLFRLSKMDMVNKYPIKEKKRGFWYGLTGWFNENGELNPPYNEKVG